MKEIKPARAVRSYARVTFTATLALGGFFTAASPSIAQMPAGPGRWPETIFEHLDQKAGLAGPVVQAISEDASGFLWFATENGISRWDGYHFRTYAMQPGVDGALPENNIFSLYADPQKRFWIGSKSRGLILFDPALNRFTAHVPPGKTGTYAAIYTLITDGGQGLWVGTRRGLDHFDPATNIFRRVELAWPGKKPNERPAIQSLVRDTSGRVWAGTTKGLFCSGVNGQDFTFVPAFKDKDGKDFAVHVWSLKFDHAGRLWMGLTQGAFVLESGSQVARRVVESGATSALDTQGVDTITEASPGTMWLGTYQNGIVSVDESTMETHRISHDITQQSSLASDNVVVLHTDRAGSIWAGTIRAVSRSDQGSQGVMTYLGRPGVGVDTARAISGSDVTAALSTKNGNLWLGYNAGGVEVFDKAGTRIASLVPSAAKSKTALPAGQISGMAEAPDGSVFIGTQDWVYRVDTTGKHATQLPMGKGIESTSHVHSLLYDAGVLWIGPDAGGLFRQSLTLGVLEAALPVPAVGEGITGLARGAGNDLWVGTATQVVRYNVATGTAVGFAVDPANPNALSAAVTSLLFDKQGRLWVTTFGAGLCLMEHPESAGKPKFRRLIAGLPNNNADDIQQSSDGELWVSTDDGLAKIDPRTYVITALHQPDGVAIPAYWNEAGSSSADGRIFFGGLGGLTVVQPSLVKPWSFVPKVAVSAVRIAGKLVPFDESSTAPIRVRHDDNSLEVEFSALDYTATELNQYEYRLVGFDHDWVPTDATRRSASYTNLPPGQYTLEMRGSSRSGVWGVTRKVAVRVVPAWWQTWWARSIYALLFVCSLWAAFLASTALMRRRQRALERKVQERTRELKQLTVELEDSHRTMEKIAYSDSLTGLANRRMFTDYFRRLLSRARRDGTGFAMLLIDLDKFKQINDTYGHDAGDAWLKEVADRISPIVRESDCFARLGGDEFAILLASETSAAGVQLVCEKIAAQFLNPVMVDGIAIRTTLSLGVAMYPEDGEEQEELYKASDLALYEVKRDGGNGWRRYAVGRST